jgi:hypothetical protein
MIQYSAPVLFERCRHGALDARFRGHDGLN